MPNAELLPLPSSPRGPETPKPLRQVTDLNSQRKDALRIIIAENTFDTGLQADSAEVGKVAKPIPVEELRTLRVFFGLKEAPR